jgi:hypothetical protein
MVELGSAWIKYCQAKGISFGVASVGSGQLNDMLTNELSLDDISSAMSTDDYPGDGDRAIGLEAISQLRIFFAGLN